MLVGVCVVGYNGKVYDMNTAWNDSYLNECVSILFNEMFRDFKHQHLNESKGGFIKITERQLHSIIKEITQYLVA